MRDTADILRILAAAWLLACLPTAARAEEPFASAVAPPEAQTERAPAVRAWLHGLIREHTVFTYRELKEQLKYTDADPVSPGNVRLIYTGWSLPADAFGNGKSEWSREHVWAKSRGDFGTAPGAGTDLHSVRACDVTMNNRRGNLGFDDGGEEILDNDGLTRCHKDGDSWEPRDEDKGDVARMLFYMAVRYEDPQLDLELVEDLAGRGEKEPTHGRLSTLIRWHERDPPDSFERFRHERIAERQGNRNPFIDCPELVGVIWEAE